MPPVGDVARRVDVGQTGRAEFVDDDPVLKLDPRAREPIDLGLNANADDRQVAGYALARRGHDLLEATGAAKLGDALAETQVDAVLAMDLSVQASDRFA